MLSATTIAGLSIAAAQLGLLTSSDLKWILLALALPTDAATTIVRRLQARHHPPHE